MSLPAGVVNTLVGFELEYLDSSLSCSGRVAAVQAKRSRVELDVFTRTAVNVHGVVQARTVRHAVATSRYGLHSPEWAPDGRSLLFVKDDNYVGSERSLWKVRVDGHGLQRLSAYVDSYSPRGLGIWSPDGRHVFFLRRVGTSGTSQPLEGVVMDADGSHSKVVLSVPGSFIGTSAAWSPDAKSIAVEWQSYPPEGGLPTAAIQIVNATSGAATMIRVSDTANVRVVDWQALPGGRAVRCADHGAASITIQPKVTG